MATQFAAEIGQAALAVDIFPLGGTQAGVVVATALDLLDRLEGDQLAIADRRRLANQLRLTLQQIDGLPVGGDLTLEGEDLVLRLMGAGQFLGPPDLAVECARIAGSLVASRCARRPGVAGRSMLSIAAQ